MKRPRINSVFLWLAAVCWLIVSAKIANLVIGLYSPPAPSILVHGLYILVLFPAVALMVVWHDRYTKTNTTTKLHKNTTRAKTRGGKNWLSDSTAFVFLLIARFAMLLGFSGFLLSILLSQFGIVEMLFIAMFTGLAVDAAMSVCHPTLAVTRPQSQWLDFVFRASFFADEPKSFAYSMCVICLALLMVIALMLRFLGIWWVAT